MLKFYAQNELISNLMPATGLKITGTGACLPWCSIFSSFQNSLKTSGHRGYGFLEFWCWNLVPFLPDIGFQLLKSSWSSLPRGNGVRDFQQECQIWTRLTIEHFSTLKRSILNEPWPTGHDAASGPCSHMASFLHDRALVGICRWHGGLCLPTVVSGSIPGPI